MPANTKTSSSECYELLGSERVSELLACPFDVVQSLLGSEFEGALTLFVEACFDKTFAELEGGEWELFRKWHASTSEDENLEGIFRSLSRDVEESVELYFMDLASASETYSGDFFNDDTHESFYCAAREVNSLGVRSQLEFLRDNAPSDYRRMLGAAGLKFILPRRERAEA